MTHVLIQRLAKKHMRKVPDVQPGFTVRVHEKITEGEKQRVQVFEGIILSVHHGHTDTDASFTVRKVVSGIGVEKVFPLHSPIIEKIDVKKVAKVRRAKLTFIRGRSGKSARMTERLTNSDEFAVPGDEQPVIDAVTQEAEVVEAPKEETPKEEAAA